MRRQLKLGPDIAIGEASQAVFSVHDRLEQFGIVMGQRIETGAAAAGGILLACGDTLQIAFGVGAHSDKPADILNRSRLEIRLFTDGSLLANAAASVLTESIGYARHLLIWSEARNVKLLLRRAAGALLR